MIPVYHLVWIIPISAVAGAAILVYIVLVDDCLRREVGRKERSDSNGKD
jgi:hypothetical protein